ncbi:AAA family ATPase [Simkania negevensis]|uniref:Archaeal ATPase family protein n=1 Tax=Simkania negevensis (strain ATCC VR-1471 / DSM 27360 / Z) TaxID=331113 RepID=F8L6R5_SIMNZ|nr:ATP-binding protein [Simkania negevensis]CCB88413.1 archaeal ATPase family protein [Simkania negevensis Z]
MKNDLFIGREKELERLSSLLRKKTASLVVVRGRRRIGKSRLIQEFAKGKRFLSFAGIPPNGDIDAQSQRDVFAEQLGKQIGLESISAQDWSTLFSLLAKYTNQGQVIVLLDEISWMGSKDPLFLGKLKNAWDLEFKNNPNLILILCGSVSTWIEKNIISHTAFFGRISLFLELQELPLNTCHEFLLSKKFHQSPYEEFKFLSVTGGIPWYLEQVQSGLNADQNIRDLCFRKDGMLFHEFDSIFHDLFERRSGIYRAIVEALANGPTEFNEICKKLNYSKSGTLSEYLNDLVQSGFVSRDYTWWVKSGKSSQLSQYRLRDNYLRFYLKYILPNRDKIIRERFEDVNISSFPGWNAIMGLQFENLVLNNRKKLWKSLRICPEDVVADNPYFQKPSSTKKGCQIDYLVQTKFNTLFACEIKFSIHPLKMNVVEEVKQKIQNIALPKRFSCWPILIHVNGVCDSIRDSGYFSEIIDFSALLT